LALAPTNTEILNSLAVVYSTQGNFEAAQEVLLRLVNEVPANLDYRLNLGVVQTQLEDYFAAMHTLQAILEAEPNYIRAYVVLGQVYEVQDRLEDAKRIYEVALKRWPNEVVFQNALNELVSK